MSENCNFLFSQSKCRTLQFFHFLKKSTILKIQFSFPLFCSYLSQETKSFHSIPSNFYQSPNKVLRNFRKNVDLFKQKTPNFKCDKIINSQPQNLPMCWKNLSTLSTEFSKNWEDSLFKGHPLVKFRYFQKYYRIWTTHGAHFETYQKWKISPAMSCPKFKKWNNFL